MWPFGPPGKCNVRVKSINPFINSQSPKIANPIKTLRPRSKRPATLKFTHPRNTPQWPGCYCCGCLYFGRKNCHRTFRLKMSDMFPTVNCIVFGRRYSILISLLSAMLAARLLEEVGSTKVTLREWKLCEAIRRASALLNEYTAQKLPNHTNACRCPPNTRFRHPSILHISWYRNICWGNPDHPYKP